MKQKIASAGTYMRTAMMIRPDRMRFVNFLSFVFMLILSATITCWPMIVNRQPFLLSDTMTYIRGADSAAFTSFGAATDWTQRYHERFDQVPATSSGQPAKGKPIVLAGRSIYYGAFLYVADRLAGLRLAVVLQAALVVICLLFTITRFGRMPVNPAAKYVLILTTALSLGSPLAFFTCYLEPDLSCALAILAAAHLISVRPPMNKGTTIFWVTVSSVCALMHMSTPLILIVIALGAVIASFWSKGVSRRGIALVTAGIMVGMAGEAIFDAAVLQHFGSPPVRPPFLMARLIADGPGRKYLEEQCPRAGFSLCHHLRSLSSYDSSADSDEFLWSRDVSNGVFSATNDPDEQRRIAAEEIPFVMAVFSNRPLAVLKGSASAIAQQSTMWHLSEFNIAPAARKQFDEGLPPRILKAQEESLALNQKMPVRFAETLTVPIALISVVLLFLSSWGARSWGPPLVFPAILLLGVAADVMICGAFSTPHDRYLMRVAWLIPLAGMIGTVARLSTPVCDQQEGGEISVSKTNHRGRLNLMLF